MREATMNRNSILEIRKSGCPAYSGNAGPVIGTITHDPERGYKFFPAVSGRMPSKKWHATYEACFPRWTGGLDRTEARTLVMLGEARNDPPHQA